MGIDPGLTGAVAWLALPAANARPLLLDVQDMPVVDMKSGKTTKKFLNLPALGSMMRHPVAGLPELCAIEQVGAMPGQGVTSMFRFGYAAGAAAGAVAAHGIPTTLVRPQEWQRAFGIRGDKDRSRMLASQAFPYKAESFKRKKDNGRSDAVLIALSAAARAANINLQ